MRACAAMLVGGVLNPRCLREINVFIARLVLIVVGVTTRIFFAAIWANSRRCVSIWRGRGPRGNGWRMSEACSGDVLLGPGVDPRNGEPPAVYQARAGGGLFGVWPSALDQHRWTRQHHTRCTGRGFGVWSASRYLHRAGCGFMQSACCIIGGVVDHAVPDSAARGEIGGAPRTLQRAQKSARPSDFARGSTGPLGGGQRAARRQGGL